MRYVVDVVEVVEVVVDVVVEEVEVELIDVVVVVEVVDMNRAYCSIAIFPPAKTTIIAASAATYLIRIIALSS